MNKKKIIVIVSIIAAVVLLFAFIIGTYNGIAQAREAVYAADSNIDTTLQRRADLIPNLVSTVKSLNEHEKDIVTAVTDARAAMVGAQTTEDKLAANQQLSTAITNLMVVVENYPDIKSSAAYTTLMDELSGTENRITVARKDYNEAVDLYNKKIISFPGNLFAGIFGFERAEYYEASAGADTTPNVGELFG